MVSYGFDREKIIFRYAAGARYLGQALELQLDFDEIPESIGKLAEVSHEKYLAGYGCNSPDNDVEIVNYCLKTVIPQDNQPLESMKYNAETDRYDTACSKVLADGEWIDCDPYTWSSLPQDARIQGPATVEDDMTTCSIPKNWIGLLQDDGSLLLKREEN